MLWSKSASLQEINRACKGTLCEQLGIEFCEVGDDFLVASMPVDERTRQPAGLLHGGASAALAETLGSIASTLCIRSENKMPVGVELNANHLKAVTSGKVFGTVRSVRCGKNLHVWNIEIRNEEGALTCVSRLTVMIVDRRKS